jgi:hypothetical protein
MKASPARFATIIESDATITVGSRAYDPLHRSRLDYDRNKLIADSLKAFRLNPLARRIVKLYRQFAIGRRLAVQTPRALEQKFITTFWNHPINALDDQIPEWFDERTLTGNLFLLFSVDPAGFPLVRAIPTEQVQSIERRENDYRQETRYITDPLSGEGWAALDPAAPPQTSFVRHYVINRPVGSAWGESDMFPLLSWMARFTGWLDNRATLNYYRQMFVWIVSGPYASDAARNARQAQILSSPPRPGSILVKDNSETWEVKRPELDSFEASADGLALKKMIAAGAGIPLHYLAEPESSTRTTAEAAGTPTFRNFEEYQQSFFAILRDVLTCALTIASLSNPRLNPAAKLEIHGQDISERDNASLALALSRVEEPLADLYDRKMIDTREFLRLVHSYGGQTYDETKDQPEGLRRPVSDRNRNKPPTPPPLKTDPETGNLIEQGEA